MKMKSVIVVKKENQWQVTDVELATFENEEDVCADYTEQFSSDNNLGTMIYYHKAEDYYYAFVEDK